MSTKTNYKEEELLIKRLRQGDARAFSEIYACYASDLVAFTSSKLFSLEEARDLVHDLFVSLWMQRERIRPDTSLAPYLFSMARYRIIDHIRKNIKKQEYSFMLNYFNEAAENNVEKECDLKDLNHLIERALQKLPVKTREIYHLSRYENKAIPEIANALDLSPQTVKNQLSFALKHLRQSLSKLPLPLLLLFLR